MAHLDCALLICQTPGNRMTEQGTVLIKSHPKFVWDFIFEMLNRRLTLLIRRSIYFQLVCQNISDRQRK